MDDQTREAFHEALATLELNSRAARHDADNGAGTYAAYKRGYADGVRAAALELCNHMCSYLFTTGEGGIGEEG